MRVPLGAQLIYIAPVIVGGIIVLGLIAGLAWQRDRPMDPPVEGTRNNPLNIRATSDEWMGQIGVDDGFVVFIEPKWGRRAGMRILAQYRREGHDTLNTVIARWTPPSENDTAAYAQAVATSTGLDPRQTIPNVAAAYAAVAVAMQVEETGHRFPADPALYAPWFSPR